MTERLLVKLRNASTALRAAGSGADLRPLFDRPVTGLLGFDVRPAWFVAEMGDAADTPWDLAHSRVAERLGVDGSDVLFAEPDMVHDVYRTEDHPPDAAALLGAAGPDCTTPIDQQDVHGEAKGPGFAWHLGDAFSGLDSARRAVAFQAPRTRIAHLDTGYDADHVTLPRGLRRDLQHNFVESDGNPGSAVDPDNKKFLFDNSSHGTGTLGILAGGAAPAHSAVEIGGAPDAEIVPLRIADTVILLKTSAFARALAYAVEKGCDVVSMSMGGLPSEAWRETVDAAYEAGVVIVTAAGNNFRGAPTRHVVYPARYGRVIAACGVMADGRSYAHLNGIAMEGNFGPDKVMKHALAAYTPNIPWAVFRCPDRLRLNGGGTSSATPQVAAAAALWLEKYKAELPRSWRRVEAVRKALFDTARAGNQKELGHGILQAHRALAVRPQLDLPQTKSDGDSFAFLRVITGLGLDGPTPRDRMFDLEIAQRWLLDPRLQELVPDPDVQDLPPAKQKEFMEALIEDGKSSRALRTHVANRYRSVTGAAPPPSPGPAPVVPAAVKACDDQPPLPDPAYRRLRAYAMDPGASTQLATAALNEITLKVGWEPLERGPRGEYLEIDDVDASGETWEGVDLDDPRLLATDGWAPSEGNPQFHQQMTYAVAMKTIGHFERALGRPVLWRHRANPEDPDDDGAFEQRLKVQPHALQQANAFYSPDLIALRFGYFEAAADDPGSHMPGSRVYTCLSHDVVAHETTHAILDGMHRRFNEPTNVDVLALHEAFADIVALLQHFTIRETLEAEIGRTRGDLKAESTLGSLAVQFGKASGRRGALRDAIGRMENGVWRRIEPDPTELSRKLAPHARGSILVGAVFDAFLAIYETRVADLVRLGTGGTGVLPNGAIHPDLVHRLAEEASTAAGHVLNMCIRALDYLPPVDVTFFEYLRAIITADFDVVRDDRYNYRVAFVEAFRRRGIYPLDLETDPRAAVRTLSVDTLRWRGLDDAAWADADPKAVRREYDAIVKRLKRYADQSLYLTDRKELFQRTRRERAALHGQLAKVFGTVPGFARALGLDPAIGSFEVHSLRPAMRMSPDGRHVPQVVVQLTQSKALDPGRPADAPGNRIRGGATLIVDLTVPEVKYQIGKGIHNAPRIARTLEFARAVAADPFRGLFFAPDRAEPFAALHSLAEDGRTDG